MKPICVKCQRFYRVKKNGYSFIEGMPIVDRAVVGVRGNGEWQPYKLWVGDLWECPDCLAQIIVGTGLNPISEHYQPEFVAQVEKYGPQLQVNDC